MAQNNLGNVALLSNDLISARQYYSAAVEADSTNEEAHYTLAVTLEKLHLPREAAIEYQLFIKTATPEYQHLVPRVKQKLLSMNRLDDHP